MDEVELSGKKREYLIIAITVMFYVLTIATKNLYSAEIVEIIREFKTTKTSASLAMTFYFMSYAFSQLIVAKILPKINIIKSVLILTFLSSVNVALTPFCTDLWQIYILFALNAVFQSLSWPCCIYVVSNYLSESSIPKANMTLGTGYAIGFVIDYFLAAMFIRFFNWKVGFWFLGLAYFVCILFFVFIISSAEKIPKKKGKFVLKTTNDTIKSVKDNYRIFYCTVCFGCFVGTFMYAGVSGWITALFCDVYNVSSANSALISVLVPIIVVLGPLLTSVFCEKKVYWTVIIFCTSCCIVSALLLSFLYDYNILVSLVLSVLFIVFARGIAHIYETIILLKSKDFTDVSVFAAVTNFFAALGSALGPIAVGKIIDSSSRGLSYLFMFVCGILILLSVVLPYKYIKGYN